MLLELALPELISYAFNIVVITATFCSWFLNRRHNRDMANMLNSLYERSQRLTDILTDVHAKAQAKDIVSSVRAVARNFMHREVDEVEGERSNLLMEIWRRIRKWILSWMP